MIKRLSIIFIGQVSVFTCFAQIISSKINVSNITTTGMTISWNNNQNATSYIRYGHTKNLELGTLSAGSTQNPSIQITGGIPSQVYYVQAVAEVGSAQQASDTLVFITASNSSGNIKVYFNRPVNTDYASSSENHAVQLPNAIDDTLIAYINRAQQSIDIMVYNLGSAAGISDIADAINQAYLNGRSVRVIYNQDTGNAGVTELNSNIPRLISPAPQFPDGHGIMHNKVFIFDAFASNANLPLVWTGSTNLTTQQVNTDPNNVIIVQDQSLARAYTMEFEEMWGSSSLTPNTSNSFFGPFKKDNTPHVFNIGGRRVECFFSPSDGVNSRISQAINEANNDLIVNTMLITRNDLVDAIVQRKNAGTDVQVMVNHPNEGNMQNQYNVLLSNLSYRIITFSEIPQSGTLHHKLMIGNTKSNNNPFVLTGSHNWSTSAEVRNDENTLVIYDAEIANQYYQEFMGRLGALASAEHFEAFSTLSVYPNPSTNMVTVSSTSSDYIDEIVLISQDGKVLQQIVPNSETKETQIELQHLSPGVYFLNISVEGLRHVEKIVLR